MTEAPPPQPDVDPAQHLVDTSDHEMSPADKVRSTRFSGVWIGTIAAAFVLVLLLVFILQNTRSVRISYLGVSGEMPLGVALLFATIGGLLFASLVASLRVLQLRHRRVQRGKPSNR